MPEAQELKNSEIFEEVWEKATSRIDELTSDAKERKFLKSMVMGGTVAAETVLNNAESARRYWGEGNAGWAAEISQLFSFLMLKPGLPLGDGKARRSQEHRAQGGQRYQADIRLRHRARAVHRRLHALRPAVQL